MNSSDTITISDLIVDDTRDRPHITVSDGVNSIEILKSDLLYWDSDTIELPWELAQELGLC